MHPWEGQNYVSIFPPPCDQMSKYCTPARRSIAEARVQPDAPNTCIAAARIQPDAPNTCIAATRVQPNAPNIYNIFLTEVVNLDKCIMHILACIGFSRSMLPTVHIPSYYKPEQHSIV